MNLKNDKIITNRINRIEVIKGTKKGHFRVMVNFVQEGAEFQSFVNANNEALKLQSHYIPSSLILFVQEEK